jgi:putative PIN family toxin of toxin-antitoxin system
VVLDTSVLVAAIRSPLGASRALLDAALRGKIEILISTALVLEYEAVFTRPEHLLVASHTIEEVQVILDAICKSGIRVHAYWRWRPQLQDPDDEMVLETAITGCANAIVTSNRIDFIQSGGHFGLMILSPREALERVAVQ